MKKKDKIYLLYEMTVADYQNPLMHDSAPCSFVYRKKEAVAWCGDDGRFKKDGDVYFDLAKGEMMRWFESLGLLEGKEKD
jgi:hypothetical protein